VTSYCVLTGGDFMAMGRLVVPGLAFNAIIMAWLIEDVIDGLGRYRGLVVPLTALVVAIGLLPGWDVHLAPESMRARYKFRHNSKFFSNEYEQWEFQKSHLIEWMALGRALAAHARPGDRLVRGPIGAAGYYSGLFIYDQCGLVNTEVAARQVKGRLNSPGHDKCVPGPFFLKYQPEIIYAELIKESEVVARNQILKNSGFADQYAPEYGLAVGAESEGGQALYLLMFRRIPDGVDSDQAWAMMWERWAKFQ